MQSEDRPIHFSTELVYDPQQIEKTQLQELYFDLTQAPNLDYDNTQFGQVPLARFYTKRGEKSQSMLAVLNDRMGIMEEWVDISLSDYIAKVATVSDLFMEKFSIDEYRAQSVLMRTTFGLSHYEDSRKFLFDQLCGLEDNILPHFQRPISSGCLKFVLPATPQHEGTINVSIEPFKESPRELYVEVRSVFAAQHTSLLNSGDLESNIRLTREFINENVFPFLDQYDTAQPV